MRFASILFAFLAVTGCTDERCEDQRLRAEEVYRDALEHDAPMVRRYAMEGDSPEAGCLRFLDHRGVLVEKKPDRLGPGGTALCRVVALSPSYEQSDARTRAAHVCHEAVHIATQMRIGCGEFFKQYADPVLRVGHEATPLAVGHWVREQMGSTEHWVQRSIDHRSSRANSFYKLFGIVDETCVAEIWSAANTEHKELADGKEV
jgi:hypothetical protein